jgi:hypothetical protein
LNILRSPCLKLPFFAFMSKRILSIFIFLFFSVSAWAQVGGSYTYAFLNIPASARIAALGGTFISVKDNDLNASLQNPSVLNPAMSNNLLFNYVIYFDGVSFGDAAYARDYGKAGTFSANMHFANYGTFKETDVTGQEIGTFHAADYNLNIGWGYRLNKFFSVGANLKTIYSNYYTYNSFGLGADLAATYYDSISQFTAAILARNIGAELKGYNPGEHEPLPVEADIAFSKRLAHTPLRFSLTYRHLEKFDLAYTDPNDVSEVDPVTGESTVTTYSFGNKLSRHIILAAEILLSKNFHLRTAYNFQRRQELAIDGSPGTTGLSWGFGIKISKFIISYGSASYHVAGSANHFSIATNLSDFIKK